jgi:hypothetical protein
MQQTYRAWFGPVLTVVVSVLCLVSLLIVTFQNGVEQGLRAAPWLVLVAGSCWALFWRPHVVVSDGGVRMVNVTRTIDLPWPAIHSIDTKWALTLLTAYGKYTAWAAPAPGVHQAMRSTKHDVEHLPASTYSEDGIRPGDLPSSPSGNAALLIRRHWEELRDAGFLDDPKLEHDRATVNWHWRTLLVGAAVIGLVVGTMVL